MSNRTGVTPGRGGTAAGFISELAAGPTLFIGKIETAAGACSLTRSGGIPVQIKLGDPVCQGDIIETAADGQVGIRFIDGTVNGIARAVRYVGSRARTIQSGRVQTYQRLVVGAVVLLMLLVVLKGA